MSEFFISYTNSDRDWAFWIAKELEALGHAPHIHEWEVKGGDDIYAWMEQRHDAADHVLCVVSDDYLKAPYSALERNAASWQAASKRPGFVLFVVVKTCKLPTLSDHIRRCELFGVPEDAARVRFRAFMTAPRPPSAITFPGKVFAVSNIPIRLPAHFMGRDDALAAIDLALRRHEDRAAIATLHGLRGVGKTTLAVAYAQHHRGDYRATWWIRAQTEAGMRADLIALGARLDWVGADDKEEPALSAVMERLLHEGEGILLIFDNAADANALRPYLPRGDGCQVLVTSNAQAWRGVAIPIEIRLWPKTIGAEYLLARTGREGEREAAERLSEALGGLPLAHEQAAAFCERLEKSLGDYLRRFEVAPTQLLDDDRDAPAEYHDRLTVAKTFALAIEEASKLHPAAEPLISRASLLASDPIPLFLFSESSANFGEALATDLGGDGLDEAVAALRAFALVDREALVDERDASIKIDTIRLHRLVREVAAARCGSDGRDQSRRDLLTALVAVYPNDGNNNPASWPRCGLLTPHVLAICKTAMDDVATEEGVLLNRAGQYFHGRATYSVARVLLERALAIHEKTLGAEHPETATILSNLGFLLKDQGDLAGARPLYERALAINEKSLGPEHPETATVLNNLAVLLMKLGGLDVARPLYERALAIRMKVLGPEDQLTAASLDQLGNLLQHQGELAKARALYERALAIKEKVLGPEHPEATSLNNLAVLFCRQGDLSAAVPLAKRALAINEKALGPEHPYTATCLNNLAGSLSNQGDLAGARPLYERALTIREKTLGRDHPETAESLNNLGHLLHAQGNFAAARPLYKDALAISERVSGPDHPNSALHMGNLAKLRHDQGDLAEARPLYERALALHEKVLGREHQNTNRVRSNFARLLLADGNPTEALAFAETALAGHEKALGTDHAWTRDSARVAADALVTLERAKETASVRGPANQG